MKAKLKIGVVLAGSSGTNRLVLRGIGKFTAQRWDWSLRRAVKRAHALESLASWRPDGIIWIVDEVQPTAQPLPLINTCGHLVTVGTHKPEGSGAAVWCDPRATGSLALEHLIEMGHRNLACLGFDGESVSTTFYDGFMEAARRNAIDARAMLLPCTDGSSSHNLEQERAIAAWLRKLGRPVGLFAVCDRLAANVCELVHDLGLSVPDDVAVIAPGNDVDLASISRPELSTVDLPLELAGFQAAELLAELIAGGPRREVALRPTQVARRRSSESFCVEDEQVRQVLEFIHRNPHRPIQVPDVLSAVPTSRRVLEQRFRQALGRTIMEEIRRAHVRLATRLLAESSDSMNSVAHQSGLSSATHLGVLIRKYTGMTPLDYRNQARV